MSRLMSAVVLVANLCVGIPEESRHISHGMVATIVILNGKCKRRCICPQPTYTLVTHDQLMAAIIATVV